MIKFSITKLKEEPLSYISTLSESEAVDMINSLKHYYYYISSPLVSDNTYDTVEEYYRNKFPDNLEFQKIGHYIKIDRVGKVELPYYTSSLDKIKPNTPAIQNFSKKYPGQCVLSDKLDGQSLVLEGTQTEWKIYTRGNGYIGQDVSHLSKYLNLPKPEDGVCIRAEFEISEIKFSKLFPDAKNARNTIGGLLTKKTIDPVIIKEVEVIAYSIFHPLMKPSQQFLKLESMGFAVSTYELVDSISEGYLINYYKKRKAESEYKIDGIVITHNELYDNITSKKPKHSKAFKLDNQGQSNDESVVAVVKDVIWQTSRYGVLKPVVNIEPVNICGVTISKATGFNYKFIKDNCIGKDSEVLIIRSGDVIPYIIEVVKSTESIFPTVDYHLSETGIDAIEDNVSDERNIKSINNFFTVIKVEYFSIGIITRFYNKGFDSIKKILEMSVNDMLTVDGVKEKSANKIYNNIHKSLKDVKLSTIMSASGCFGKNFGQSRFDSILEQNNTILDIKSENAIYAIVNKTTGFSDKLSNRFVENLPTFKIFLKDIGKYINIDYSVVKDVQVDSDILANEVLLFTGFRDSELSQLILNSGGTISKTFSKKVTIVLVNDYNYVNSKVNKAKSSGVVILSKDDFIEKFKLLRNHTF